MPALPDSERVVAVDGRNLVIRHHADLDPLIDAMTEEEQRDERIPYYGELWPASIGLARWLTRHRRLQDRSLLDLGCGAGLVGIAASLAGAQVCFADYLAPALELTRNNAAINGIADIHSEQLDWRSTSWRRHFDVIAGGDVLYERRAHAPILSLLDRCLRDGDEAVLADPGRGTLEPFVELVQARGLFLERDVIVLEDDVGPKPPVIQILVIRQRRAVAANG